MRRDETATLFDESKVGANELLTLCSVQVLLVGAKNLVAADLTGSSDPFCKVSVDGLTRQTKVVPKSLAPIWNETFTFYTEKPPKVQFQVFDEDNLTKADPLGDTEYDTKALFDDPKADNKEGASWEGSLTLKNIKKGEIQVKITCRSLTPIKTEKLLELTEQQLRDMHGKLQLKAKEIESMQAKADSYKAEAEELRKQAASHASEKEVLEKEVSSLRGAVEAKNGKIQEMERELDGMKHTIEIHKNSCNCTVS